MTHFGNVVATALVALFFSANIACAGEATFVGNEAELDAALLAAEQGAIGSIGITGRFYQEGTQRTKDRIRGLIARAFEIGSRIVYVSGSPSDTTLVKELLDIGVTVCTAAYFPGEPLYGRARVTCLSRGQGLPPDTMRKWLHDQDAEDRKAGEKTLP